MMIHYCVTGRHRSGTTGMMKALTFGSALSPVVDFSLDEKMATFHPSPDPTYKPQGPTGKYFLPPDGTLPSDYDGRLIKVSMRNEMWVRAETGPDHQYMIVWMVRNENERTISWNRAFGNPEHPGHVAQYPVREEIVTNLPNATITTVNYKDLVADPISEFTKLQAVGWPIDPASCAALIDPALYRNKG